MDVDCVVTDIKDTSFWKQFTTYWKLFIRISSCYWYQRYLILKAIHNRLSISLYSLQVVTDIKDTSFWKQFTTFNHETKFIDELLLISKIPHFESNSQLINTRGENTNCCYWYQRYLILKAIHNRYMVGILKTSVVTDIKDTSFWKQFTTSLLFSMIRSCCYWYQRYLILKAIHNL